MSESNVKEVLSAVMRSPEFLLLLVIVVGVVVGVLVKWAF